MAEPTEAIKELAAAAMAYGVMLVLEFRDDLARDMRDAGPTASLADALGHRVDSLLELRPRLVDNITGGAS